MRVSSAVLMCSVQRGHARLFFAGDGGAALSSKLAGVPLVVNSQQAKETCRNE